MEFKKANCTIGNSEDFTTHDSIVKRVDHYELSEALKFAIDATRNSFMKEKIRIMEKLMKDYGDKFFTEGVSEYIRKRDELDEMFREKIENDISREWPERERRIEE